MATTEPTTHPLRGRLWLALPIVLIGYCIAVASAGDLRAEHLVITLGVSALAYAGGKARRFMIDMAPYFLIALGYDAVRYVRQAVVQSDHVLGCGLRNAELKLFSVSPGVTTQDWFAVHHSAPFDLLAAIPYTVFIYLAFAYAAFLFFVDRPRMRQYLWSLALANYIAFAMWILLPAAPPWYIRANGCAIDLAALPNAAGLTRVDELLGIHYFATFYARSSSVFGAMPSMHCAYPMLGLFTAWRSTTWKTRPLHIIYAAWMFAAAVYLDHHWILDALAGWMVALAAVVAVDFATRRWFSERGSDAAREGVGASPHPAFLPWLRLRRARARDSLSEHTLHTK